MWRFLFFGIWVVFMFLWLCFILCELVVSSALKFGYLFLIVFGGLGFIFLCWFMTFSFVCARPIGRATISIVNLV